MTGLIDIIIVNHNTKQELLDCLASLYAARPASVDRIIVADNASADGSVAAVSSAWAAVRTIELSENRGFGAANNAALRESRAEFVLFLNSDTIVPAGAVDTLLERLRARGAIAAGPKLIDGTGRPEVSFGPMLTPWAEFRQRRLVRQAASRLPADMKAIDALVSQERLVDWVSGACLLINRAAALAAGGFDERFFLYEEDVDLCATIRTRGGTILFTPKASVTHLRGRTVGQSAPGDRSAYDRSHVAFYEKHGPRWVPLLKTWLRLRGRAIR